MKSVSLTQARRGLSKLIASEQAVEVTSRGQAVGTLRIYAEATVDRDKAMEAARQLRAIGSKYRPSKRHGGAAAVRQLRDHGK